MGWLKKLGMAALGGVGAAVLGQTDIVKSVMGEGMLQDAVIGGAIGALGSAVSGGKVSEGLLFGAIGGFVSDGLQSMGSTAFNSWFATDSKTEAPSVAGDFFTGPKETASFTSVSMNENVMGGIGEGVRNVGEKAAEEGGGLFGGWDKGMTQTLMTVGGPMLAGLFSEDQEANAQQASTEESQRQFDLLRADKEAAKDKAREGLSSYRVTPGNFKKGIAVADQVQNRMLTGFSKEAVGATV